MKRDLNRLGDGPFDLLVIGGGIYGAWTAYDASLRGLTVALIEKSDWASGTSSASTKLIHGGLRYLEHFHFGLVRRALHERRRLSLLAPHRVTPLRFLIPLYRDSRVGRLRLRAGLWLYDRMAGKKQPVGLHESLSSDEVTSRHSYLASEGLAGGLTYGDCLTDDAQFALEIVAGAAEHGAVVANYVEATRILTSGKRAIGASIVDKITGDVMDVEASVVVNATAMWPPAFGDASVRPPRIRMSKGVHLVMPALPTNEAMLIMSRRDKRVIFTIPWYGKTLLGTTDADYQGDLDNVRVDDGDIDYLLDEASRVIREPRWSRSMIEGKFAGVRALKYEPGKSPSAVTREWALESPMDRLLVSIGGKFTSARSEAAAIVDRAMAWLGKATGRAPTSNKRFPWSPHERFATWQTNTHDRCVQLGMDRETAEYAVRRHGTSIAVIQSLIEEHPDLAGRLDARLPFCRAEILVGARERMALTLEDLLRRRTPILILARVDRAVVHTAAELAASVLGWNEQRCHEEIERVVEAWE